MAEFGYGGKLIPTFPIDPKVARKLAWLLESPNCMPYITFDMLLERS